MNRFSKNKNVANNTPTSIACKIYPFGTYIRRLLDFKVYLHKRNVSTPWHPKITCIFMINIVCTFTTILIDVLDDQ